MKPEPPGGGRIWMPWAVTPVRPWARCGRASPTVIKAPARIGSSHIKRPIRLRPRRATSRAKLTSEYSMAATGPRRPRHSSTIGNSASNHSHSGCRNRVMSLLRGRCFLRFGGCQHECARALAQGLHVLQGQRQRREFHEVALLEELSQQSSMTCERCVGTLQQLAQELLRGSTGSRDIELLLDVAADNIGYGSGEFPGARGLHERGCLPGAAAPSRAATKPARRGRGAY